MKTKIFSLICIILILTNLYSTPAFADSINNNGIKFIGEVKTTKKYYDGDILLREEVIFNGYCVDENNNSINVNLNNIIIPTIAEINKHEFIIYNNGNKYTGNINIDVVPFDPIVNFDSFSLELVSYNIDNKLDDIRQSIKAFLWQQVSKISFYNNIGNKLEVNYEKVTVDTSNVQLIAGIYVIPYEVNFYTKNLKKENVYNSVSGTFEIEIVASEISKVGTTTATAKLTESLTPSLTANSLLLDTSTSYNINIDDGLTGSTYEWISDDITVAKVNSKNGIVTALKEGKANISCKITKPDKTITTLKAEVIVGSDIDNSPILTETNLDLTINDTFDVNVQNKISKSKYYWKSSNKSVATVNSSNGIVKAVGVGNTTITCTITTPELDVIVLKCDITVE